VEDLPGRLHPQGARRSLILPAHVAAAKQQQYAARLTWFLRKREALGHVTLLANTEAPPREKRVRANMSTNMAARVGEHAGKAGSTGSTGEDSKAVARRHAVSVSCCPCPCAARVPACVCDSPPPVAHCLGQAAKRVDAAHGARAAAVSCSPETAPCAAPCTRHAAAACLHRHCSCALHDARAWLCSMRSPAARLTRCPGLRAFDGTTDGPRRRA